MKKVFFSDLLKLPGVSPEYLQPVLDVLPIAIEVWQPVRESETILRFDLVTRNVKFESIVGRLAAEPRLNNPAGSPSLFAILERVNRTGFSEAGRITLEAHDDLRVFDVRCSAFGTGLLVCYEDITGQAIAEQLQLDKRHFIEEIANSTPDIVYVLDLPERRFVFKNKRTEEILGISEPETIEKGHEIFFEIVHREDYVRLMQHFTQLEADVSGQILELEIRLKVRNGRHHWFRLRDRVFKRKADGTAIRIIGIATDINQQRVWQEQLAGFRERQHRENVQLRAELGGVSPSKLDLAEDHRRMREAQAIGHIGSFECDASIDNMVCSEELLRIHGLRAGETINFEKLMSFVHPEDREHLSANAKSHSDPTNRRSIVYRIIRADGEIRTVLMTLQALSDKKGRILRFIGTVQDITEHINTERKLQEQSHYLQRIQFTVPDMISVTDLRTRKFEYLNKETFRMHGFDPDLMDRQSAEELNAMIHPDDVKKLANYFSGFKEADDDTILTAEYRAKGKACEWKWFLVRGRAFRRDDNEEVTHVLNVIQDIDDRKKDEQEIIQLKDELARKAKDKYLSLFRSIEQGFCVIDVIYDEFDKPVDYRFIEVNPAFERQTGLAGACGKTIRSISPAHEEHWFRIYGDIATTGNATRFEARLTSPDRWCEVYAFRIGEPKQKRVAVLFNDISDRKQTQQRQVYLLRLSDAIRSVSDPIIVEGTIAEIALDHFQTDRCCYCTIEGEEVVIRRDARREKQASLSGSYPVSRFTEFKKIIDQGHPLTCNDVRNDGSLDESLRQLCIALNVISFITVPLIKHGVTAGIFCLVQCEPRRWTNSEIELARITADRMWEAVERANAQASLLELTDTLERKVRQRTMALRESRDLLQSVFDSSTNGFAVVEIVRNRDGKVINFRFVLANRTAQLMLGRDKLTGTLLTNHDPTITGPLLLENLKKMIEKGGPERLDNHPDEAAVNQRLSYTAVKLQDRIVLTFEDISAKKKAAFVIRENIHFIKQIADTTPDIIYILDLQTRQVMYSNRQLAFKLGYSKSQAAKMKNPFFELMHADDRPAMLEHLEKIKTISTDDRIVEIEYRMMNAQGGITWFRDRNSVFRRNEAGIPVEKLGFSQDITARKKAEEQEVTNHKMLHQAEEIAEIGSWEYDLLTRALKWSDGMYRIFNLPKGILVSPGIYLDYTAKDDKDTIRGILHKIQVSFEDFEEVITIEPENSNSKTIRVKGSVMRDRNRKPVKIIGIDVNITEQVKAAAEIQNLNKTLLQKNRELQALNTELKTFNTITSRDYKATLQILYTNLEYLVNKDGRNLSDMSKANVRRAQAAIQRMKLLTDDISHYLRLFDFDRKLQLIDPNPIVRQALERLRAKAELTGAEIKSGKLPMLHSDPVLFEQLLFHLVDNSLKFGNTDTGTVVNISHSHVNEIEGLEGTMKADSNVIITISDNGIGFEEQYEEKVFELFFKVHDNRQYKGSGIGLACCKKVMELHKGFIRAESATGRGAKFHCFFPEKKDG